MAVLSHCVKTKNDLIYYLLMFEMIGQLIINVGEKMPNE